MSESDEDCQYFEGVAGDDLAIPFQLIDENGVPVKIGAADGVTDIVAEFNSGTNTLVQVKQSTGGIALVDSTCGRGLINVAAAVSATLSTSAKKRQTFTVYIVKNAKQTTWVFDNGLLLRPRPVPVV